MPKAYKTGKRAGTGKYSLGNTLLCVRKAKIKDIPIIVNLWKELTNYHMKIPGWFQRISSDGPKNFGKFVKSTIKSRKGLVLVAVDEEEKVIGYILSFIGKYPPVFKDKLFGFISDISVNSNARRKGTGSILVKETMNWFKTKNIKNIELNVAANNKIGYPFWKKCGFKDFCHRLYLKF